MRIKWGGGLCDVTELSVKYLGKSLKSPILLVLHYFEYIIIYFFLLGSDNSYWGT